MTQRKPLSVFAPAKINLYLRVTGRLDNGYHALDSLVAFADIGDRIRIESAEEFSFSVTGPYASAFTAAERDGSAESKNLAVRAIWALSHALERTPRFRITLEKNLPLASGLGGGSADAAAALWGAMEWWGLSPHATPHLNNLMMKLGADIPACLACRPVIMSGAGDILTPAPTLPEVPLVLVNPGKPCSTAQVFSAFRGPFSPPAETPTDLHDFDELAWFIEEQGNDLLPAAISIVPKITDAIETLQAQPGCATAGMSGSGATCFGLFRDEEDALRAAESLQAARPSWWVRAGTINRPERY
ncbi:MAG TPA: 4-(cytidine 5'-diphospho)-2-C-methyl-D-erythritol kinase [Alphaproteobacteria bacterium]